MILTDREILIALHCKQLVIDPNPSPESFSSTSVDLTLADSGLEWASNSSISIRPGRSGYKYSDIAKLQNTVKLRPYTLDPKSFLLAWTTEIVHLPIHSRLAARVEGKSSLARLGVGVHVTAPTIHAGFKGPIQLEIFNFGPHQIILDAGMKICQLIIEQTAGTPDKGYSGQFLGQGAS